MGDYGWPAGQKRLRSRGKVPTRSDPPDLVSEGGLGIPDFFCGQIDFSLQKKGVCGTILSLIVHFQRPIRLMIRSIRLLSGRMLDDLPVSRVSLYHSTGVFGHV
jgi:hypothetical protein